jgi:RNA polymerase primary sigma factor
MRSDDIIMSEGVAELLAAGSAHGYLTWRDILERLPEFEDDVDSLAAMLDLLEAEGIEIQADSTTEQDEDGVEATGRRRAQRDRETDLDLIDVDDSIGLYFRDVRPIPLLTAHEEAELAQQIERGKEAQVRLDETGTNLTAEERWRLETEARSGREALDQLIEANYRLVISIAKRYRGRGVPWLDLIQEGNLGLIPAAEKFDHSRGNKFATYATWWVRQAVVRALADQGATIRVPIHMKDRIRRVKELSGQLEKALGRRPTPVELAEASELSLLQVNRALDATRQPISLDEPVGDDDSTTSRDFVAAENGPDPADELDQVLLAKELESVLGGLTPREARVIRMHYGLRGSREYTLKEIGDRFGLSRERIRQIEQDALRKLRSPQRSQRLREYLN